MPRAAQSRALLEEARATIAEVLGWRHDVIFTSGASEADRDRGGAARRSPGRAHGATEHAIVPSCDGRGVAGHSGRRATG